MLSFQLSEEQQALQEMARRFAREEILPRAAEFNVSGEYPKEIARQAFDLGLMNITVPEEYGGGGLDHVDEVLITEELNYGCAGIAICISTNNLATIPVAIAGSDEIKKQYLGALTSEYSVASYCISEPDAGSDVAGASTRAERKGDKYIINGNKAWITGGAHARWFVVFAYTDQSVGHKGMSVFVVPADAPGITIGKKEDMMGQRASNTVFLTFEDVEIPVDHRLGEEGDGFSIAMRTFDRSRPAIAAAAVGISRRAMEESIRYAKERRAFGTPIANHQAVQFMLADMYKEVLAGQLLTYYAAWKIDQGERNTLECSAAKVFGADAAMRITTDAVQIFGGYGYSKEYPVEKLMRDAKVLQIYEGTSQIQRIIIARQLLAD